MRHGKIVDDLSEYLGGQRQLGERFGLNNTTMCHWKDDGIPARHWPRLLDLAARVGYPLTLKQIVAGSPLTARTSRSGSRSGSLQAQQES